MEERLRTRDLVQAAESFVEFYARSCRVRSRAQRAWSISPGTSRRSSVEALTLTPARIFARLPQDAALAQFPENARVDALTVPVEYRFAPGEAEDGATLKLPLLALPR